MGKSENHLLTFHILIFNMPNYILCGQDSFRKRSFLAKAKRDFRKKNSSINIDRLFFGQTPFSSQDLQARLQAVPFLGRKRLLIIYYPFANTSAQSRIKLLIEQFIAVPPSTQLIIVENELKNRTVRKRLEKKGFRIEEFRPIYGYRLNSWINQRAGKLGLSIDPLALEIIVDYLGSDTGRIDQELKKLREYLSYHYQKKIGPEDVKTVVTPTPKLAIFGLLDKMADQDFKGASRHLEDMINSGISESYLILMLERTVSSLLMAKDYSRGKTSLSPRTLQKKFGWHPYVAQKVYRQIKKYNKKTLISFFQHLLEAEVRIKSGFSQPKLQLTLLLGQLRL